MTSLRADQISLTARTFTSTKRRGGASPRVVSSVMSLGTLADFFGDRPQERRVLQWRPPCDDAQLGGDARLLREWRAGVAGPWGSHGTDEDAERGTSQQSPRWRPGDPCRRWSGYIVIRRCAARRNMPFTALWTSIQTMMAIATGRASVNPSALGLATIPRKAMKKG